MDMVFDNYEIISMLSSRGEAIKESNNAKIFQLEHLIKQFRDKQYDTDISGIFITFENDRDVKMAQEIIETTKLQIFGK